MVFKPGQSGNPLGRPSGSRNRFSEQFYRDLAATWEANGAEAMQKCALTEPSKFVAICASLIPKDVSVTLSARLPGNLELEDYDLFKELLEAAKAAIPRYNDRRPGEIAELMLSALRAHTAPLITSSDQETASHRSE